MRDDELRARLCKAVDQQLSGLEGDPWLARRIIQSEKGDSPVMKKKLSVSLILVIVTMLLTLSAAVALVNSHIAGQLYGPQATPPQAVLEQIHTPQVTAEKPLGTLSMDEWLYDGHSLHTAFTVTNPSDEPLLYTLDGIWLNGQHITYDHINTEGAGDSGFLLGGTVDGTAMPASTTIYNMGTELYQFDTAGKYLGRLPLPEGQGKVKVSVAVWRPVNPVELVDYDQYEGYDVTVTKDHLTADARGLSSLWLFRPEDCYLSCNASQLPSAVYADTYKQLGWMELVDTLQVEVDVDLNKNAFARAIPKQTEFEQNGCRIVLEQFDMSLSGGAIEGWVYGDDSTVRTLLDGGLHAVDKASQRVLSYGSWWDDQDAESKGGMHFHISLGPMTGELPDEISLVHITAWDNRWDETDPLYDPSLEKPENVYGMCQVDFSCEIAVPLEKVQ